MDDYGNEITVGYWPSGCGYYSIASLLRAQYFYLLDDEDWRL